MNTPPTTSTQDIMLDTAVLKIPYPQFEARRPELFHPALNIVAVSSPYHFGKNQFKKYIFNPPKADAEAGIYSPRLTVHHRFIGNQPVYDLYIEFSVPKLMFNQSLQELDNLMLEKCLDKLQFRLSRSAGIEVTKSVLRNAEVARMHFSKNIPLPDPLTAQDAIAELYKADFGRGRDINSRHYSNGGQSLYFYSGHANMIFYDKVKDVLTPKRKAVDKDKLLSEKKLVLFAKEKKETLEEVLRFEIRFNSKANLAKAVTAVTDKKVDRVSFEQIFDQELCKKMVLASWKALINRPINQLVLKRADPDELFDAVAKSLKQKTKSAHSLNKALISVATHTLANHCGSRQFRNKIEKGWSSKAWERLWEKMEESTTALHDFPSSRVIAEIEQALERFERYDWDIYLPT